MSNEKYNIEEVFKTELEDFEVDVPQNTWSNISQNIPNSVGSSIAAKTSLLSSKALLIASSILLTTAVASIVVITQSKKQTHTPTLRTTEHNNIAEKPTKIENNFQPVIEEEKDKVLSKIEDPVITKHEKASSKKENKQYVIKTTEDTQPLSSQNMPEGKSTNPEMIPEKELITPAAPITKEVEIIEVEKTELVTSISASPIGGPAPLVVDFSHPNETHQTIWKINDQEFSIANTTSHTFEKAGKYEITLEVIDKEGNSAFDSKIITVTPTSSITDIPNIFSPNNDFINDNFVVNHENISSFSLYIYNKKSELIFETQDIETGWNGENNYGEPVTAGDYIYIIRAEGIDGKQFEEKGIIKLVR